MEITLTQFETIDGFYSQLIRIDFETCDDPRGYISMSNRLYDALIDVVGYDAASACGDHIELAGEIITSCLMGVTGIVEEV